MSLYFTFEKNNKTQLTELPLRLPLEEVYKKGSETVPVGVVKTGVLRPGMKVTFAPSSTRAVEVISIEPHGKTAKDKWVEPHRTTAMDKLVELHGTIAIDKSVKPSGTTAMDKWVEPNRLLIDKAVPGDHAGFYVKSVHVKDLERGMVAGDANNDPPEEAESFTALITVLNHPGEIRAGYTEVVKVHTAYISCTFTYLLQKFSSSGSIVEENAEKLKQGDIALVNLVPTKPLCVETFKDYPPLGNIIVRGKRRTTVAIGIIISVKKKEKYVERA